MVGTVRFVDLAALLNLLCSARPLQPSVGTSCRSLRVHLLAYTLRQQPARNLPHPATAPAYRRLRRQPVKVAKALNGHR